MLNKKITLFLLFTLTLAVMLSSCSAGPSLCEVSFDDNSSMPVADIGITPPGETGTPDQTIDDSFSIVYADNAVTSAKNDVIRQITFPESGNSYSIEGVVYFEFKDGKYQITGYDLTVKGGVFGETPQTCKK